MFYIINTFLIKWHCKEHDNISTLYNIFIMFISHYSTNYKVKVCNWWIPCIIFYVYISIVFNEELNIGRVRHHWKNPSALLTSPNSSSSLKTTFAIPLILASSPLSTLHWEISRREMSSGKLFILIFHSEPEPEGCGGFT